MSRRLKLKKGIINNLQHRLRNLFYFNQAASAIPGVIHFAVAVLAQLDANAIRPDTHRLARKTDLVLQLHQWGYNEDNVRVLFRIIDAMMALPEPLETVFEEAVRKIEEETQMTYITSVERVRLKREREEGKAEGFASLLSAQITRKFGVLPDWAKVRLVSADEASLNHWAEQILDAQCIEDVFK